jgi:hypothetical protein
MLDNTLHPHTRAFVQAWLRLEASDAPRPDRAEALVGSDGADVAGRVFVVDVPDGTGPAGFRRLGPHVGDLLPQPAPHIFAELWTGPDGLIAEGVARSAVARGGPAVLRALALTANRTQLELELALAPLDSGVRAGRSRLIGLIQPLGSVAVLAGRPVMSWVLRAAFPARARRATPHLRLVAQR